MKIQEYISQIKLLGEEKRAERAILLCMNIRNIAKREGISTAHINNVYKQLLDNRTVDKDELSSFQMDVSEQWGKNVGLSSSIVIKNNNDIDVTEL